MSEKITEEMLEIVNEDDEIIGIETRKKVHEEGLLHREIHIWFLTPKGEIIFQHRAKNKDTFPDKLDATVGGHVDPEMSYEETVIKECKEETGIDIDLEKLIFLKKIKIKTSDKDTGLINNTIRNQYAYLYEGLVSNLEIEKGKAIGFEVWSIDKLSQLEKGDTDRFIPLILTDEFLSMFDQARKKLSV